MNRLDLLLIIATVLGLLIAARGNARPLGEHYRSGLAETPVVGADNHRDELPAAPATLPRRPLVPHYQPQTLSSDSKDLIPVSPVFVNLELLAGYRLHSDTFETLLAVSTPLFGNVRPALTLGVNRIGLGLEWRALGAHLVLDPRDGSLQPAVTLRTFRW